MSIESDAVHLCMRIGVFYPGLCLLQNRSLKDRNSLANAFSWWLRLIELVRPGLLFTQEMMDLVFSH